MSHFELESRVHQYLSEQREQERGRRDNLIAQIARLRGSKLLPGEYPDQFVEELKQTPLDWQIDIFEEGVRFKRDFPYESEFYDMRGWDAARVVVNLDPEKSTVALRVALYDQNADVGFDEGVLVESGEVISFDQEINSTTLYEPIIYRLTREQESTKGESGCIIDHLREELDRLPSMVKQLSGNSYGRYLASFYQGVGEGKINLKSFNRVAIGWPLLSPYNAAPSEE